MVDTVQAKKLRDLMVFAGNKSAADFAEYIGVSPSTVTRVLRGDRAEEKASAALVSATWKTMSLLPEYWNSEWSLSVGAAVVTRLGRGWAKSEQPGWIRHEDDRSEVNAEQVRRLKVPHVVGFASDERVAPVGRVDVTVPIQIDAISRALAKSIESAIGASGGAWPYEHKLKDIATKAIADAVGGEIEAAFRSPEFVSELRGRVRAAILRGAEIAAEANGKKAGGRAAAALVEGKAPRD